MLTASQIGTAARRFQAAYAAVMAPLSRELGMAPSALDILLYLANTPDRNPARDICAYRHLKPGIVSNACFARFKVEVQGETTVEYSCSQTISGGLIYNGVKIAPVVTQGAAIGTTVTWKVVRG